MPNSFTTTGTSVSKKSDKPNPVNLCSRITSYPIGFFKNNLLPRIIPEMTEVRFKNVAYLQGDIFWGRGLEVFALDGRGTDRIITKAADLAAKHDSHMCHWKFGPKQSVLLPLNPRTISNILKQKSNFCDHDSSKSFENFFGSDTIFSQNSDTEKWRHLSSQFTSTLLTDTALEAAAEPMKDITARYLEKIENSKGEPINFSEMANHIGLDMIGIKLGLTNVSDSLKTQIGELISRGVETISSHRSQALKKYFPFLKLGSVTPADKICKEAITFIKDKVLPQNEDSILENSNWLNPEKELTKTGLYETQTVQRIMESYVAGSETSATWLLHTCMLLADSKNARVVDKLRQEIKEHDVSGAQWTYKRVQNLSYFNSVLDEVLRLYPSIPDIVFECTKNTEIEGSGTLRPGDLLIISARFTQRLKTADAWGPDADEFRPERFEEDAYRRHPNRTHLYFPFGFGKRTCPGRKFARLEIISVLIELLDKYDFSFADKNLHHPFGAYQRFTLQSALAEVQLCFIPREMQKQHDMPCAVAKSQIAGAPILKPMGDDFDEEEKGNSYTYF